MGLAGWIVWERVNDRDEVVKAMTIQTIRNLEAIASFSNDGIMSEIGANVFKDRNLKNKEYETRAKKARDIADVFKKKIYQTIDELCDYEKRGGPNQDLKQFNISQLKKEAEVLKDSLLALTGYAETVKTILPDLTLSNVYYHDFPKRKTFSSDWVTGYFKLAQKIDKILIFNNLIAYSTLAEQVVLRYFWEETGGKTRKESFYQPTSVVKNPSPLVGELFETNIMLAQYSDFADNITVKINGVEQQPEKGLYYYRRRYDTPGSKSYNVEFLVTNPYTKEVKIFKKEFAVTVLKPCRE